MSLGYSRFSIPDLVQEQRNAPPKTVLMTDSVCGNENAVDPIEANLARFEALISSLNRRRTWFVVEPKTEQDPRCINLDFASQTGDDGTSAHERALSF